MSSEPRCTDVLVLGAGPAGCAAAITARSMGLGAVVAERFATPRDRPGESLHPGVEPLLRQLGVWSSIDAAGFVRNAGYHVTWNGPRRFVPFGCDERGPWRGLQVRRDELDRLLVERALALGIVLLRPCEAISPIIEGDAVAGVRTTAGDVRSTVVIDATGAKSWIARRLGHRVVHRSPRLVARYGYCRGDGRDLRVPSVVADRDGWTWVARVGRGLYAWVRLDVRGRTRARSWRPHEVRSLRPVGRAEGADVTWRSADCLAGPGYLLAGDAAAVLDPASSHGVLKALMSGIGAADAAARMCRGDSPTGVADRYADWMTRWFEHDVRGLRAHYAIFGDAVGRWG